MKWLTLGLAVGFSALVIGGIFSLQSQNNALAHNYQVTCLADSQLRDTLRAVLVVRIRDPRTSKAVKIAFRKYVHRLDRLPATCLNNGRP